MTQPNLFDLSGKIALVCGASRGIGESIATTLAAYGARVIVSGRKREGCEAVAARIRADGGLAEARACHIGDLAQIATLFEDIEAAHGKLDILVNNAAINPYMGPAIDTDPAVFQKTIDVNVRGPFYCSAQAVRLMGKHGGGSIINVASVNAIAPGQYQGVYSLTKAALVSMTLTFARESAAAGIRVNALVPGPTDTKLAAALIHNEQAMQTILPRLPFGRVAQPDEMAGAVLYFASAAASFTTGACLTVDGGFLLS
ncbi:MAG: SDR family oxidoreductase [Janthinobacterium lividum]